MITLDQARTLEGKAVYGPGHEELGTIDALYADRDGGEPTFATVGGRLAGRSCFVPLAEAELMGDHVMVPYGRDLVDAAPAIGAGADLSPEEEARLYAHYGVTGDGAGNAHATAGHDTSGPTTDDAMTRSEERLHVGTEEVEAGRARLRKTITSETETRTVPVSHEEVTIEREPITEGNLGKALDGPELSEEEHEVVLTEERPVVAKETVPVERVRIGTETVTEDVQVSEQVRKEQIEADGVYPSTGAPGSTAGTETTTESEFTIEPRR